MSSSLLLLCCVVDRAGRGTTTTTAVRTVVRIIELSLTKKKLSYLIRSQPSPLFLEHSRCSFRNRVAAASPREGCCRPSVPPLPLPLLIITTAVDSQLFARCLLSYAYGPLVPRFKGDLVRFEAEVLLLLYVCTPSTWYILLVYQVRTSNSSGARIFREALVDTGMNVVDVRYPTISRSTTNDEPDENISVSYIDNDH